MYRYISRWSTRLRTSRWGVFVVVAGCMGLSGCANLDLRGESYQYDPALEMDSETRRNDNQVEPVAVTNKAMQIERNLGVR